MAENKKGFILYCDLIHTLEQLPNDKAGELFKHILRYVNGQNPTTSDLITNITFEPIKQQLKRDLKQWEESLIQKSNSGKIGNLKRWNNDLYLQVIDNKLSIEDAEIIADSRKVSHPDKNNRKVSHPDKVQSHPIAKIAVNVNVNDNVNVIDKEEYNTDKSEIPISANSKKFTTPTVLEIKAYCLERNNSIDAEYFCNFYESKGWMVGKNKMKDWKACVRTWEKSSNNNSNNGANKQNNGRPSEEQHLSMVELGIRNAERQIRDNNLSR